MNAIVVRPRWRVGTAFALAASFLWLLPAALSAGAFLDKAGGTASEKTGRSASTASGTSIADWGNWRTLGTPIIAKALGVEALDADGYQGLEKNIPPFTYKSIPPAKQALQLKISNAKAKAHPYQLAFTEQPSMVDASGVLQGKTIIAISDGDDFDYDIDQGYQCKLALCSDGTLAGWGVLDSMHRPTAPSPPRNTGSAKPSPTRVYLLPTRIDLPSGVKATAIASSGGVAMVLTSDGQVYEWGLHTRDVCIGRDEYAGYRNLFDKSLAKIRDHFNPAHPDGVTFEPTSEASIDVLPGINQNTRLRVPFEKAMATDDPVHVNYGALQGRKVIAISYDQLTDDAVVLCADGAVVSWGAVWQFKTNGVGQVAGTFGLGQPTVVNRDNLLTDKKVIQVAGRNALCSDGSVVCWPTAFNGKIHPYLLNDPDNELAGRKIAKITQGFVLYTDGTIAARPENEHELAEMKVADLSDTLLPVDDPLLQTRKIVDISGNYLHFTALCDDGSVVVGTVDGGANPAADGTLKTAYSPDPARLHVSVKLLDTSAIPKEKQVLAVAPEMLLLGDKPASQAQQ